ncbi:FCD domain-containing protein [Nocardioides carbamazepini]
MDEARNLHEFHHADVEFHLGLARLSGNVIASMMLSSLSGAVC